VRLEKAREGEKFLIALVYSNFAADETKGLDVVAARKKRISLFTDRTESVAKKAGELAAKVGEKVLTVDAHSQTISVNLDGKGALALADWAAKAELKDRFRIVPLEQLQLVDPPPDVDAKNATETLDLSPVTERTLTILARGGIALASPDFKSGALIAKTDSASLERLRLDGVIGSCTLAERRAFRAKWAAWEKENLPVAFTIEDLTAAKLAALTRTRRTVKFDSFDGGKATGRGTAAAVDSLRKAGILSGAARSR
jgi:hypothetical protein